MESGFFTQGFKNLVTNVLMCVCISAILSYPVMLALNFIFNLNMNLVQAFAFMILYWMHEGYINKVKLADLKRYDAMQ